VTLVLIIDQVHQLVMNVHKVTLMIIFMLIANLVDQNTINVTNVAKKNVLFVKLEEIYQTVPVLLEPLKLMELVYLVLITVLLVSVLKITVSPVLKEDSIQKLVIVHMVNMMMVPKIQTVKHVIRDVLDVMHLIFTVPSVTSTERMNQNVNVLKE
jgi:hypothetical protein